MPFTKYRIVKRWDRYVPQYKLLFFRWEDFDMLDYWYLAYDTFEEAEEFIIRRLKDDKDEVIKEYN